ncbi:hypothetical protein X975_02865, partial [Stegodyphus mimosarum]
MQLRIFNPFGILILLVLIFSEVISKPLEKKIISTLLTAPHETQIQQSKQFIGSSVIGGLMSPVLLTLLVTAIMARIPDALQRLLSGSGGGSSRYLFRNGLNDQAQRLDQLNNFFLTAVNKMEN